MLVLLLAAQAVTPPAGDSQGLEPIGAHDPPVAMIDFLGRRSQCAYSDVPAREQARLRCAALAGEESALRTRFVDDAGALRWLNQPPLDFRMRTRFISTFDGPDPVRPRTVAQSGVDDRGRPYQLVIDTRADHGRSTRITAVYDNRPERSFTLENRAVPLLDLQTLTVGVQEVPDDQRLTVRILYGHDRTYCGEAGDNREEIRIAFGAAGASAYAMRRTNCQRVYENVMDAAAR